MSNCNCRDEIEAQLTERFKAHAPEASDHRVTLEGYGFAIVNNTLVMKPAMPYKAYALFPNKKTGADKGKTMKGAMVFRFCPFCGVEVGATT